MYIKNIILSNMVMQIFKRNDYENGKKVQRKDLEFEVI